MLLIWPPGKAQTHKWFCVQSQEGESKQEYLETLEQKHEQNQATIAQLEQELARLKEEAEEVQVCGFQRLSFDSLSLDISMMIRSEKCELTSKAVNDCQSELARLVGFKCIGSVRAYGRCIQGLAVDTLC